MSWEYTLGRRRLHLLSSRKVRRRQIALASDVAAGRRRTTDRCVVLECWLRRLRRICSRRIELAAAAAVLRRPAGANACNRTAPRRRGGKFLIGKMSRPLPFVGPSARSSSSDGGDVVSSYHPGGGTCWSEPESVLW